MPSTGTPSSNTAFGARSSCSSYVEAWLPERMTPFGANSRTNASLTSFGWISQKTCASRMRRAISCVTCEPKSRIRILSCMSGGAWRGRSGDAPHARCVEVAPGERERDKLHERTEVERRADAPVAARQVRDDAQQRRGEDGSDDCHQ